MLLTDFLSAMDEIAPTRLAEAWDNVGLLVGDPAQQVGRAMLTIDYTSDVATEAQAAGVDLVIAYHPPLFHPLKRLTADSSARLIYDAARRGVAIYSPHTAIDVADGGTNDMLADAMGVPADAREALRVVQPQATQLKLVTFVPPEALDRVADALFAAGAGRIGDYSRCSFRSPGTGTFFGEAGTNPTVGQAGTLETAEEIRIETVLPVKCVGEALAALRKSHPYEEPAFDLVQLASPPEKTGQGRVGELGKPTPRAELVERIKRELSLERLLVAGPESGDITRVACCAGSCGDLLDDAIARGAQLYLTGEIKHHEALKAAAAGMTVVCTLHSNSERAVLNRLRAKLVQRLPELMIEISQRDRDPFVIR
jgi:dinuclear metal center YbgI/SA1388 family protein